MAPRTTKAVAPFAEKETTAFSWREAFTERR
jgi:hypothetical protein